ncbi:MAG TPA: hypothetical protein VKU01_11355 [Bryobacteraceae bacterium]|nr:hypothetical protein [Bryobacteraceae bacterium]
MSISPTSSLSSSYLQSVLSTALQGTGLTSTHSLSKTTDQAQISTLGQMMNSLSSLQKSDPTKYKEVTQQIATNLEKASQAAQSQGNSTAAKQLSALASDFTDASKSGQLPNLQNLAQAAGGHSRHHGAHRANDNDGDDKASQLVSALQQQTDDSQNESLNPVSIIQSTLNNAGVTAAKS